MDWSIGNGERVILGKYLWTGVIGNYFLSLSLKDSLCDSGFSKSVDVG